MLTLIDLITIRGIKLGDYKIHCASDNPDSGWKPLESYLEGTFEHHQRNHTRKDFECENVISLINLGGGKRWLFVGVYKVNGYKEEKDKYMYRHNLERVPGLEDLEGRVVVAFEKNFRASYLVGANFRDKLIVSEIRENKFSEHPERSYDQFPGTHKFVLTFTQLQSIIAKGDLTWRKALEHMPGVYVIVDAKNGKQYVGSAYGEKGLWQRWKEYARNGHGGDKELKKLVEKDRGYARKYFQFGLLEICNRTAGNDEVARREKHWKDLLLTKKFGYNKN